MPPSPWQKFLKLLGLKTIDDRIEAVRREAAEEEKAFQDEFYYEKDLFAKDQDALHRHKNLYRLGHYENPYGEEIDVRIKPEEFQVHKYVIGTTGTGKTCFIEGLINQHILREDGAGLIDVHGDIYERVCRSIALKAESLDDPEQYLREKVVLIDFTDDERVPGINPLSAFPGLTSDRQANQLILIFRRFYKDLWGVKIEELARFGFMALIESQDTMIELEPLFTDESFRNDVLAKVKTPDIKRYFHTQFSQDQQYVGSLLNKLRPLLLDRKIQSVIGQAKSTIHFREIIDQGKIMLVNLNKSYLSANADIMAAMFMGWIQNAALSRRDIPEKQRRPFFLYVDEFQNFANEQFEEILTETRKYHLYITMAHQSLSQLDVRLRHITLGNTDIHCFFRVESGDTEVLGKGAFEARGGLEKPVLSPYEQPGSYTDREEIAMYQKSMASIPNRHFYYRNKKKEYKSRLLRSLDIGTPVNISDDRVKEYLQISKESYTVRSSELASKRRDWTPPPVEPAKPKPGTKKQRDSSRYPDDIPDIADFGEK